MDIHNTLQQDLVTALKAKDSATVDALRSVKSALQEAAIAEGPLDESRAFAVFKKQIKQRKDSAAEYRAAGREDLAEPEEVQAAVLEKYLPEQLSGEELEAKVRAIVEASEVKEFGPLMGKVMGELKDVADGGEVKGALQAVLNSMNS